MTVEPAPLLRALIVEDDPSLRELIRGALDRAGFDTAEAAEGRHALDLARGQPFELIVLDRRLLDLDGTVVCMAIRRDTVNRDTPILMATIRATEADKVIGLESGADDYLVKPFGERELVARAMAMVRRAQRLRGQAFARSRDGDERGGVALDHAKRTAIVRGNGVDLTRQEFDLLDALTAQPGVVFSRADLARHVARADRPMTERTIDALIRRIRRKIEHDPRHPDFLLTARGAGYKLRDGGRREPVYVRLPRPVDEDARTHTRRTLVVDDEASVRDVVRQHLQLAGFDVTEIGDGARALDLARTTPFDLILLDIMLPGIDGVTLCRALRAEGANTHSAMLMLTAKDAESDKVLGLDNGADDYMTKPFGSRELVARATALLRAQQRMQREARAATGRVERSGISLDPDRRHAAIRGTAVELTKLEFDLLHLLVSHPGIVFGRDALVAHVWGGDASVTDRTVDTVVSRTRKKIEVDARDPELILTAWGVGYKFVDAD